VIFIAGHADGQTSGLFGVGNFHGAISKGEQVLPREGFFRQKPLNDCFFGKLARIARSSVDVPTEIRVDLEISGPAGERVLVIEDRSCNFTGNYKLLVAALVERARRVRFFSASGDWGGEPFAMPETDTVFSGVARSAAFLAFGVVVLDFPDLAVVDPDPTAAFGEAVRPLFLRTIFRVAESGALAERILGAAARNSA